MLVGGEAPLIPFFGSLVAAVFAFAFLVYGFPTALLLIDVMNARVKLVGSTWQKILFGLELIFYVQVALLPPWIFLGENEYSVLPIKVVLTPVVGLALWAVNRRWGLVGQQAQSEVA